MTPWQLVDRLRAIKTSLDTAGPRLENIAARELLQNVPPGVSVRTVRTPTGVSIVLSGRGARAHARRALPAMKAAAKEAVHP